MGWLQGKELGALKERSGEVELKASDDNDGYTVTVPASFEKADANFVYVNLTASTDGTYFSDCRRSVLHG